MISLCFSVLKYQLAGKIAGWHSEGISQYARFWFRTRELEPRAQEVWILSRNTGFM